ncbi:hypothetical protein SAMN05428941_0115 [Streptomyces sp. 2114.2]|nr:hypothetical protein BX268_0111 [Streptomyces sp. 2221.1]SDS23965.1 hypothetical protein SAMN05428941_0115 [Streptomyces sp. 2114.2]
MLDEAAGVIAVGPDQVQAVVGGGHPLQQDVGGIAIADIRHGDHHAQKQDVNTRT